MLQQLPPEIISHIVAYLSDEARSALALTCYCCYHAALPHMYHRLYLTEPNHLFRLLSRKAIWGKHASRFTQKVSLSCKDDRIRAPYAVKAVLLGHVMSGWELLEEAEEKQNQGTHYGEFLYQIEHLFPRISTLSLDFDLMVPYFSFSKAYHQSTFQGALSVFHYRPGQTRSLRQLLQPLSDVTKLSVRTRPYLSLCAALQDSLLTDDDIGALADMNLQHVTDFDLANVDDTMCLQQFGRLVTSMLSLKHLSLEFVLPPSTSYFDEMAALLHRAHLYPQTAERLERTYRVDFYSKYTISL